jgi:hypothetical protein
LKKNSHDGGAVAGQGNQTTSAESKSDTNSKDISVVNDAQTVSSAPISQAADLEVGMEGVNDDVWRNILSLVKPINASIEALLRAAKPLTYDGKSLTLGVYYKFHKERLEDAHHRLILEDVVSKVLKSSTKVVCTLVDPPPKKVIEEVKTEAVLTEGKDTDIMKVAEEIFGN